MWKIHFLYFNNYQPVALIFVLKINTSLLLSKHRDHSSYITMLFMRLSSAFDTIILYKMTNKRYAPGLTTFKHDCILDTSFSHQPPSLRLGKHILTLSTIVPQGCVLTPFLCALFTFYSQYTTQMSFLSLQMTQQSSGT